MYVYLTINLFLGMHSHDGKKTTKERKQFSKAITVKILEKKNSFIFNINAWWLNQNFIAIVTVIWTWTISIIVAVAGHELFVVSMYKLCYFLKWSSSDEHLYSHFVWKKSLDWCSFYSPEMWFQWQKYQCCCFSLLVGQHRDNFCFHCYWIN